VKRIVIVGGVAGGASAATRARRLDERARIVLFERGPDVSFANCGLPYYVGGVIAPRDKLLVSTAAKLRARFAIDVRTRCEVTAIDRARKVVRFRAADGAEGEEAYDVLILSPGAAPLRPPLPGIDHAGVMVLRSLQDVDRIRGAVDAGARRAVVVGAGFIGLEVVENLVHRGVSTTLVELQDQILPPFDREVTTPLVTAVREAGVEVLLGESAEAFEPDGAGIAVRLASGRRLPADLVILGIGVRPENALAVAAGLETGPRGGIRVDAAMRTSDPAILACGDCVETRDAITGGPAQVPLAGPANRQGRIAADTACARPAAYRGTQGTAIVGAFGRTMAMTGASEKALLRAGTPFARAWVHPAHHASYYPGAEPMSLKLLFSPQGGRLLGAQAVGGPGVDKRIDVIAVAIQAGMTAFDLEQVELCYAPQYGSAKDPVNMAGFVAAGLLRGDHPQVDVGAIATPATPAPFLLDVRTPQEHALGSIPGSVNLPIDDLRDRLDELPRGRSIVTYCQVGMRGYLATRILLQSGFPQTANLGGGYATWRLHHAAP